MNATTPLYKVNEKRNGAVFLGTQGGIWLLCVLAIGVYIPSIYFDYTRLDDYLLVVKASNFNSDVHHLLLAFRRGAFGGNDHFYRPILLDSFILNYQISGKQPWSYHVVNMVLHLLAVLSLHSLYKTLQLSATWAMVLAAIFAVHPVICQAVAWIPGRNEILMAIFVLSFLRWAIYYVVSGRVAWLVGAGISLLLALFTKETALMAPVAIVLLALLLPQLKVWNARLMGILVLCMVCGACWVVARSAANMVPLKLDALNTLKIALYRLPLLLQYTGKILLPFDLSVYPTLKDTSLLLGTISLCGMAILLWFAKRNVDNRFISGIVLYLLFLVPVFIVPPYMSIQTFEHRLYLPLCFFLLTIPSLVRPAYPLFANFKTPAVFVTLALLIIINILHQLHFAGVLPFWRQAVATSPTSASAHMMLAIHTPHKPEAYQHITLSRQLNHGERFIDFNTGYVYQKHGDLLASEPYFLAEKAKTNYYQCDQYLYQIALAKKDTVAAQVYQNSYKRQLQHRH